MGQLLHCTNLPLDVCNPFVRYNDKYLLASFMSCSSIGFKRADFYKAFFIINRTRRSFVRIGKQNCSWVKLIFVHNSNNSSASILLFRQWLRWWMTIELLSGIRNQEYFICDHWYTYIHTVIHFMITFVHLSVIIVY